MDGLGWPSRYTGGLFLCQNHRFINLLKGFHVFFQNSNVSAIIFVSVCKYAFQNE
jgi:hypothetical protein